MSMVFDPASLARTQAALKESAAKVAHAAPNAEHDSTSKVAEEMKARAPQDTGALAASITAQGSRAIAAVPYAGFVNFGTVNMAANPFAIDAIETSTGEVEAEMIAVFRAALGGL